MKTNALIAVRGFSLADCDKDVTIIPLTMVWIEPGTFMMGSPETEVGRDADYETQREVTLDGFYMGKYLVTQAQYQAVMGKNPSLFQPPINTQKNTANWPVDQVSWYDALVFCNRLSVMAGLTPAYRINGGTNPDRWGTVPTIWNKLPHDAWNAVEIVTDSNGYRLPTEEQWEYACRAGTTTPFNTGDNITTDQANYRGTYPYNGNPAGKYRNETTEVGSFAPNAWGLYDMHGNISEWCWDWFETGDAFRRVLRVQRGGSYNAAAEYIRSAYRIKEYPGNYFDDGFRLVRPAQ
jgi:formylglycine-generating enzyme required for sulfatase activity